MEVLKRGFLFLKPRCLADSEKVARAIAMCRGVRYVLLTSGEYGFVVELRPLSERSMAATRDRIRRISGKATIKAAIGHYFYTSSGKTEL